LLLGQTQFGQVRSLPRLDTGVATNSAFNESHAASTKRAVAVENQQRFCLDIRSYVHEISVPPLTR
jgi:hypothetical protein